MTDLSIRANRVAALKAAAKQKILILDGSWGVMFQKKGLSEVDYRADRFADYNGQMKGNNDILCLTRPDLVAELHDAYFAAGADISETNTFSGTTIAQADYRLGEQDVRDINFQGAKIGRSGRTLSGQTAEAFWNSVKHCKPFAVGFNCALGADLMRPHIAEMARIADTLVAAYPNAGLPNAMGQYDEEPHETGHALHEWAKDGLVNILGGCCGTTPDHIRHVADEVRGVTPRAIPERPKAMRLAGLEPFELA